mgnify:CR=1 FL=1|jgi:hypothetical protein
MDRVEIVAYKANAEVDRKSRTRTKDWFAQKGESLMLIH